MGKVLAMTLRNAALGLLSVLLLSACGSPVGQAVLARAAGLQSGPAAAVTPLDGRRLSVTLKAAKINFDMVPVEKDGDVTVWAAADGSQLALRQGLVIWTRGFGMDLMSAHAPSLAQLVAGSHQRVTHLLDGSDARQRQVWQCQSSPGDGEGAPPGARHVVEDCSSPAGAFQNEYWIGQGGQVLVSQQWVSPGVGYLVIDAAGG